MLIKSSKHSQRLGNKLKEKRGSDFFSGINPNRKLSEKRVKQMLEDFYNRLENRMTVPMIALKYKVTKANVYYHVNRNKK